MLSPPPPPVAASFSEHAIEYLVGGEIVETPHGACLVVERRYPLHTPRGDVAVGDLLEFPGAAAAWLDPQGRLEEIDFATTAFLDTETTGLSGAAGTLAFLVGIGRFTGGHFTVRQFFMRHPSEEPALLHAVTEWLAGATAIVTFNGRSFDLPLRATRYILARRPLPLTDAPHFDVLIAARRVWRQRLESCALSSLERDILGFSRSEEDVPGWLIPILYQQYVQQGAIEPMERVFYHNREDILSMTALAAILCRSSAAPVADESLHPIDRASLAWALEAAGEHARAEEVYRRALAQTLPDDVRRTTLARLAALLKRQERRLEAALLWQEWITSVPGDDVTPYIELAKQCEWHTHDHAAALMWSRWARQIVAGWPASAQRILTLNELDHRIARLSRKHEQG